MKKIKLLLPLATVTSLTGIVAPLLASCGNSKEESQYKIIPTDLLNIQGNNLKGLKHNADISSYNTLSIPENVVIVERNAFNDEDVDYSKITNVIIPANVIEIRDKAFAGLNNLQAIDLSAFNSINNIANLIENMGEEIFDSYDNNTNRYIPIKFSDSITETAFKTLKAALINAGCYESWFTQPTTGHVVWNDESKVKETDGLSTVQDVIHLQTIPAASEEVCVQIQRTGGTTGVNAVLDNYSLSNASNAYESNIIVNSHIDVDSNVTIKSGDYVEYKLVVWCYNPTETKWIQTIEGYKLTFKNDSVVTSRSIELNLAENSIELGLDDTFTLEANVLPKIAANRRVIWSSNNNNVATVEKGVIKAKAAGVAAITATAEDGGSSVTCQVIVNPDITGMNFEYNEGYNGYYIEYDTQRYKRTELVVPETYVGSRGKLPVVGLSSGLYEGSLLQKVTLSKNIRSINWHTFANCLKLTDVVVPEGCQLECIYDAAFENCETLAKLDLTNATKLTCIAGHVFSNDTALKSLNLPSSVYSIGNNAFGYVAKQRAGLETTKSGNIQYVKVLVEGQEKYVAEYFDPFTDAGEPIIQDYSIVFDDNTFVVGGGFLYHKIGYMYHKYGKQLTGSNLKSVSFNSKLNGISEYAFSASGSYDGGSEFVEEFFADAQLVSQVTEIEIPASVKGIGMNAFGLNSETVHSSINYLNQYINQIYRYTTPISATLKTVKLNDGLLNISDGAFWSCINLESINIPKTVTTLGGYMGSFKPSTLGSFLCCQNLKTVTFEREGGSSDLRTIGRCCFYQTAVTEFNLPEGVEELDLYCFAVNSSYWEDQTAKLKVNIPKSVTDMTAIFGNSYYTNLSYQTQISLTFDDQLSTWMLYYGGMDVPPIDNDIEFSSWSVIVNETKNIYYLTDYNDYYSEYISYYEMLCWKKNTK